MKRNYLAYGFAISIVVHLIVLPFVRPQPTVAGEELIDHVKVDRIPTPPPTPPPTPTPRATQQPTQPPHTTPQPVRQRRILIRAPHKDARPRTGAGEASNTHTDGVADGSPHADGTSGPAATGPPATASPAPAPTPRATPTPLTCARPNVAATTLRAVAPDTPAMAAQQGVTGTVQVVVSLDAQSRVTGTHVQTSPSAQLNQAALRAARESQFRTEIRDCEPVAADYIFSVDFTSQ